MSYSQSVEHLLNLSEKIAGYNADGSASLNGTNILVVRVRKYKKVYERTSEHDVHKKLFNELYNRCRTILSSNDNTDEFMLWFENEDYSLKLDKVSFPIHMIFRKACGIARNSNNESSVEFTYPEQFILDLFRIWSSIIENPHDNLKKFISEIESTLSLEEGSSLQVEDGLSGLMGMAAEILGEMGVKNPGGKALDFNPKMINEAIKNIKSDPNTKKAIKDVVAGMKLDSRDNIIQSLTGLIGKMSDNANTVPEPVKKSMDAVSSS